MDFREDRRVKTSTNRLGRSTISPLTFQAIGRMLIARHPWAITRDVGAFTRDGTYRAMIGHSMQTALLVKRLEA